MESVTKLPNEAAGTLKLGPRDRSRVVPCLTNRVLICAQIVLGIRVTSQIRAIPRTSLVHSTCVTVHGWLFVPCFIAALSKNLSSINVIYQKYEWLE